MVLQAREFDTTDMSSPATIEQPPTAGTVAAQSQKPYVRGRNRMGRRAKRFAREWLYLVACSIAAGGLSVVLLITEQSHSLDFLAPLAAGLYALIGVIRITVWATKTVREPD